ncbi:MAG: hypothetical protein EB125_12360, partial [Betaproteobacteria bacterium]|nr:hypothetical protein [Betaproteobacteria bacterium]
MGARAGLPNHQRKFPVVLTRQDFVANPANELEDTSIVSSAPRIWLWRSLSVAAVFLLIIAGWWIFRPASETKREIAAINQNQVSTRPASKTKLTLPDGSKVWLNASSKLTYGNGFGEKHREIWLEGEGYFDVARNPDKPFIIHTSVLDVKVLGTRFNLKAYPDEATTETSLLHGSVEVVLHKQPGKVIRLVPNQKLVVQNALAQLPAKAVATEQVAAAEILPSSCPELPLRPSNGPAQCARCCGKCGLQKNPP